jgi:hypothetical protein
MEEPGLDCPHERVQPRDGEMMDANGNPAGDWRDRWEATNRAAEQQRGWARAEGYPAGAESDLALRLHREGLIYRINREILHPHGLALGVSIPKGALDKDTMLATRVTALDLFDTGGEPIEYTPEQIERNERKLGEAGGH